jgi:hypothetical protein
MIILLLDISELNQKWISEFSEKLDKDIIIRVNKEVGQTYLVVLFWDED